MYSHKHLDLINCTLDIDRTSNWISSQEHCKYDIPGNLSEICKVMPHDRNGVWLPMHRVVLRTDVLHGNSLVIYSLYAFECSFLALSRYPDLCLTCDESCS